MLIRDLEFIKFITRARIQARVKALASTINTDYQGRMPVFLPVLNGSFMFAADLMKHIDGACHVSFVKISSYSGTASTGQVKTLIGLEQSLFNQDVVIVEDIVDTGLTLQKIIAELQALGTRSVEVVALLRKQPARDKNVEVRYVGFDIDNEFVVGYGLDYEGNGRNIADIYKVKA